MTGLTTGLREQVGVTELKRAYVESVGEKVITIVPAAELKPVIELKLRSKFVGPEDVVSVPRMTYVTEPARDTPIKRVRSRFLADINLKIIQS